MIFIIILLSCVAIFCQAEEGDSRKVKALVDEWVEHAMEEAKIPGVSVAIIKDHQLFYQQSYGYADKENKIPVTEDTFFELGSLSKAFTGLAILKLVQENKISLDDDIQRHIPWLILNHQGRSVEVTIADCLYHRTGIPFKTIGDIPIDSSKDALENTMRTLVGVELDFEPGERHQYATVNYAILGRIIEAVSGVTYADFMQRDVFEPLGLNDTWAGRNKLSQEGDVSLELAKGYKTGYLKTHLFDAPAYEGNTAAGYIISNTKEMVHWMSLQLGATHPPSTFKQVINDARKNELLKNSEHGHSYYAAGWEVVELPDMNDEIVLSHAGNNPNFSSFIILRPSDGVGVLVLANLNTDNISTIARQIESILLNADIKKNEWMDISMDIYQKIDLAALGMLALSLLLGLIIVLFLGLYVRDLSKLENSNRESIGRIILGIGVYLGVMAAVLYCAYLLPKVFFFSLPWSFLSVWGPFSLIPAVLVALVVVGLTGIYFLLLYYFPHRDSHVVFPLVLLSLVTGFGNAFIIFVINEALLKADMRNTLLPFFVLGIILYVLGNRVIRLKLITMTHGLVFRKRLSLIKKILGSSYERIENMEDGKIHAGLNNDTQTLSNAPNVIIAVFTSLITLFFCFIYIGIVNVYGLVFSVFLIVGGAGIYYWVGCSANRMWEEARTIENTFFKFINHMLAGFKELSLNTERKNAFEKDVVATCDEYRFKRTNASMRIANVFVFGELIFTLIIGAVVFIFPLIFKNIGLDALRSYVFVFLYMTGPVHGVLNNVPQLLHIRIAWKRLGRLNMELSRGENIPSERSLNREIAVESLALNQVEYGYEKDGKTFHVGPVSWDFKAGNITFITGGNGSGKTTLMKLICGLYAAQAGDIRVNGSKQNADDLKDIFSVVFSDYFLFERLYGIDASGKEEAIEEYLELLKIDHKVKVTQNQFSTLDLSSGQRKRLALMVSYLDDKPIFLFDEWAADQDPEFRHYFYRKLLLDLKVRGKVVIAVTHDERYFDVADEIIKMDMGKIA